jgi:hypothetical protein
MDRGANFHRCRRGDQRIGQYHFVFPEHDVGLDQPLDERVRAAWLQLAKEITRSADNLDQADTRGEFIRRAWAQR